jgi:hypothetical protein
MPLVVHCCTLLYTVVLYIWNCPLLLRTINFQERLQRNLSQIITQGSSFIRIITEKSEIITDKKEPFCVLCGWVYYIHIAF